MGILDRFKIVLSNEEGSLILEQAVLIMILLFISSALIILIFKFREISVVKAGYSTTTGWFRTSDTKGIKN